MKKNSKKKSLGYTLVVDAELDLHGYSAEMAKKETEAFLIRAQKNNFSRVRIIVGKGTRSVDGKSVLPGVVKNFLTRKGYDYTYAKIQDGGEGALLVKVLP